LWKGDGAVDKFDRLGEEQKLNLHPDLAKRIDEVMEAMKLGGNVPGMWQEYDGTCHQDWVLLACYARWYHASEPEVRSLSRDMIIAGQWEPWHVEGAVDSPDACNPAAPTKGCCPENVYKDAAYQEKSKDFDVVEDFPWLALFTVATCAVGGAVLVPKVMEKLK